MLLETGTLSIDVQYEYLIPTWKDKSWQIVSGMDSGLDASAGFIDAKGKDRLEAINMQSFRRSTNWLD